MAQYVSSSSLLVSALLFMVLQTYSATADINVVNWGAKGDGRIDSTKAFLDAWAAACGFTSPVTIYVTPGRYLLGRNAVFHGCNNHAIAIIFRIDATLVAPSDYL